jgi:uncharacterized protein (DUF58 family)
VNFAQLNHILIPRTKSGRDRFRRGRIGRWIEPSLELYRCLTPEGRVTVALAFAAAALGLDVGATQIFIVLAALMGLLAASLLVRRPFRLDGVTMTVSTAPRMAMGEEMTFSIRLENKGRRDHHGVRIGGPFLPWDGSFTGPQPVVQALPAGGAARVECRARFLERGEHHLDPFRAGALDPIGLTLGPLIRSEECKFIVVPRIARIARLATPMARKYQPGGVALASKTGESMELAGVRPYRPGDPIRDLHARTWARVGVPVVREYQEEYFTRIGVVLDIDRQVSDERTLEAALSLAAGVLQHLSRGEALIDLLVVGDRVHTLTLGRSLGVLDQALDLLACATAGPALRANELAARLAAHLPRLSCVVFVALAWDGERIQLVERIRSSGVSCRTLLVEPAPAKRRGAARRPAPDTAGAKDLTRVTTPAIEGSEPLWL